MREGGFTMTTGLTGYFAPALAEMMEAKPNGINPYDYLTHAFKTAPNSDFSSNPATLERLLPLQSQSKHIKL